LLAGCRQPGPRTSTSSPPCALRLRLLDELIRDDRRFLFFDPGGRQNYNYNANQRLTDAIRRTRGAYWDILRRYE
jgi:hypothetical protein